MVGSVLGGDTAGDIAAVLTGGATPDKIGPPEILPSDLNLQSTVTTASGDQYALVNVGGKYTWFAINDNPTLPNRYIEVVSGAKVAELTGNYLEAAGYGPQVEQHNAQVAEQHRTELREMFNRSEADYANSLGPDGQPWGTANPIAPNATQLWQMTTSSTVATNTVEITNGSGSVTRIVQTVDRRTGEVVAEHVYEDGKLVAVADTQGGSAWALNRATGEMEQVRSPSGAGVGADGLPSDAAPPRPASSAFVNDTSAHTVTLNPGAGVASRSCADAGTGQALHAR